MLGGHYKLATCKEKPYPHNKPEEWEWQIKDYESFLAPFVDMPTDKIEIIHDFEHCGWDVKIVEKLPNLLGILVNTMVGNTYIKYLAQLK